ncbi:MAG: hypothetical protein GWP14_10955 [Actinobacteria bacterium]|nr:hypothetical protein [Actinomycetota bacterium]
MDRFRIRDLLCLAGLVCLGVCISATSAQATDSAGSGQQLLAKEINRREQLAQEVSAKHLLARIKADELVAEHKFGQARQLVRKAQEMLANQREDISTSIFTFLDTLGKAKLQSINQQEIAFLRRRLEAEKNTAKQTSKAHEQPTDQTKAVSTGRSRTPASAETAVRSAGTGLGTLIRRIEYEEIPLGEALEDLRAKSGANIVANWQSLGNAGVEKTTPVNLKLYNVSAGRVLKIILDNLSTGWAKVSYVVQENVVVIASAEDLARIIDTRVYDISHLMIETKDKRGGGEFEPGGSNRRSRQGRGNSGRRNSRGSRRARSTATELRSKKIEKIIALVRAAVPQDSWRENGGPGSLTVVGTRLIVTQTVENQAKIGKSLLLIGW